MGKMSKNQFLKMQEQYGKGEINGKPIPPWKLKQMNLKMRAYHQKRGRVIYISKYFGFINGEFQVVENGPATRIEDEHGNVDYISSKID